jgi:hypothetical protein
MIGKPFLILWQIIKVEEGEMNRMSCRFKEEQSAQNWAKAKAKYNPKIEKIESGWRVTWDVVAVMNQK